MASKRETVLAAVKSLVAAALPGAEVKRNLAKAERIPPGGLVVIRDGDPGEPEVSLSPLTYLYWTLIRALTSFCQNASPVKAEVISLKVAFELPCVIPSARPRQRQAPTPHARWFSLFPSGAPLRGR